MKIFLCFRFFQFSLLGFYSQFFWVKNPNAVFFRFFFASFRLPGGSSLLPSLPLLDLPPLSGGRARVALGCSIVTQTVTRVFPRAPLFHPVKGNHLVPTYTCPACGPAFFPNHAALIGCGLDRHGFPLPRLLHPESFPGSRFCFRFCFFAAKWRPSGRQFSPIGKRADWKMFCLDTRQPPPNAC